MTEKKILIIDDETDLREPLHTALVEADFNVIEAVDGASGLTLALAEKPDLILLDISMPKMDGHQTLAELRKDSWGKSVPVILLTNLDDATNITRGFTYKSDDYIIKSNESLLSIVKRAKQRLGGYHD